jgi:hypothetical protein
MESLISYVILYIYKDYIEASNEERNQQLYVPATGQPAKGREEG